MAIGEIAPLNRGIREQWLELREELLFTGTLDDVHVRCERARSRLAVEWQAAGAERRAQIVELLAELTIDMRSYLPHWHLPAAPGPARRRHGRLRTAGARERGALPYLERCSRRPHSPRVGRAAAQQPCAMSPS